MHGALRRSRRDAIASLALSAATPCLSWARRASAQSATRPSGFDPSKTRALIVGILSWRDRRFRSFPTEGRRDATLVELLRRKGVPSANVTFLRDQQATKQNIQRAFDAALRATRPDETLLVYYAGHGARVESGEAFFVAHDATSGQLERTGWSMRSVVDAVTRSDFRGRSLLAADCCYSGSLTQEVRARTSGRPVATLTSSMASVVSTGNWTFTECLLAGFEGQGVCDLARDGRVTLDDLGRFTDAQMAFAEEQLATWSAHNGFAADWVLASAAARSCAREGERIEVLYRGQWYRAQIEGERPGAVRVHYIGYRRDWDEWVTADRCRRFAPQRFAIGSSIDVEWNGAWYPASVLAERDGIHHVHYDGFTSVWDEWVASRRCRARGVAAARSAPSSAGSNRNIGRRSR